MSTTVETPSASSSPPPLTSAGMVFRAGLVGLIYLMCLDLWFWLTPKIEDTLRALRAPISPSARFIIDWSHLLHNYLWLTLPVLVGVGALHAWAICQPGRLRAFAGWLAIALVLVFALSITLLCTGFMINLKASPGH